MNKTKLSIISGVMIVALIVSATFYYFFFSANGLGVIGRSALSNYFDAGSVAVEEIRGNVLERVAFENVVLGDLAGLPKGSILKIQRLTVAVNSFSPEGLSIGIFNGRLFLPVSDTILFNGNYESGEFDINVFAKKVSLVELLDMFADRRKLGNISGIVSNVDIDIKGTLFKPELSGSFFIAEINHDGFSLTGSPAELGLQLSDLKDQLKLNGTIELSSGNIVAHNTLVDIQPSTIVFTGDPQKPLFDFAGIAMVENTIISIALKGSIDTPDLRLASEPPMPQEQLLIMLATGKSWSGVSSGISKGQLTPDTAADFIDYFVFGGSGSKFAQKFGINGISFTYDQTTKGFQLKKGISKNTELSYGLTQSQTSTSQKQATQSIGAGVKVTDSISVEGQHQIQQDISAQESQESTTNDKVLLKFKKKF